MNARIQIVLQTDTLRREKVTSRLGLFMISGLRVGIFCVGISILLPATASALTQKQIEWCVNRDNAYSLELQTEGCTAAIKSDPRHAVANSNRCKAYQLRGDYARAFGNCDQSLSLDPKVAVAYYNRGDAYQLKRDYARGIADYSEVIRVDPEDAGAYITWSNAYKPKRDYDRAIVDYDEAVRLHPRLAPSPRAEAQNPDLPPDLPALGPYGSLKTYCGEGSIPADVATIPWIGCFLLSAGHGAKREFADQEVEVEVGARGEEIFTVNGSVVRTSANPQHGRQTNLPYVHPDGVDGYGICQRLAPAVVRRI